MLKLNNQPKAKRAIEDYPEMLKLIDVAEICGVAPVTIRRLVRSGRFIQPVGNWYSKRALISFLTDPQK